MRFENNELAQLFMLFMLEANVIPAKALTFEIIRDSSLNSFLIAF